MKIFFLCLIFVSTVFAHKVYILADDDGKVLHVKSYFTKASPCMQCSVTIFDTDNKVLDEGKTDEYGMANFPLKNKAINIAVTASMGHKNTIEYESENDVTIEENLSFKKFFLALSIMLLIFAALYILKRKK